MPRGKYEKLKKAEAEPFHCYASVHAFLAALDKLDAANEPTTMTFGNDWAGDSWTGAVEKLTRGDLDAVADAERKASAINDALNVAGDLPTWTHDVAGAFPDVPAALAGVPDTMYRREPVEDVRGRLCLAVDVSAFADADADALHRRGVIILAAVLALSRVRNVELWAFSSSYSGRSLIKLSEPLDVSEACAVFTRPATFRRLCLSHTQRQARRSKCLLDRVPAVSWCNDVAEITRRLEAAGLERPVVITRMKSANLNQYDDARLVGWLNGLIDQARADG